MGWSVRSYAGFVAGFLIAGSMASAQTSDYSSDVAAYVSAADHWVSLLNEGTTLGHWLDTRDPNDQWAEAEEDCARYFTIEHLPSKLWIPWMLYFYPPPVPSPVTFPDHGSRRDCVLGVVEVVEMEDGGRGDPYLANLMDAAAREMFTRRYGHSIGSDVPFWGPYSYPNAARWIGNAEIISGHSANTGSHCNDLHEGQGGPGNIAFVCAHSAMVRRLDLDFTHSYRYREIEDSQFHRALAIAAVDPAPTEKLQSLYRQILHGDGERLRDLFQRSVDPGSSRAQTAQPPTPTWLPSLLPVLQEWLTQLKTFPAERRAAGLLAADHLLLAAQTAGDMGGFRLGGKGQWPTERLSGEFIPNQIEKGYSYAGDWAKQARELDPSGAVGQMATIGSIAHASGCDGDDSDGPSRKVILDGEKLLSAGLDALVAAQVHFMVGDAYSDFVALAAQGVNANGFRDPDKFRAEAAADRAKALEHYRAGLAVDDASQNAQDAWRQAWRLLAGIQPVKRYVCFEEGD